MRRSTGTWTAAGSGAPLEPCPGCAQAGPGAPRSVRPTLAGPIWGAIWLCFGGPFSAGPARRCDPPRREPESGGSVPVELAAAEPHDVRTAELERREVEREALTEFLAVPGERLQELLVVGALLVPARQQRAGEVEALPVPALGDHVELAADLLLVDHLWVERV